MAADRFERQLPQLLAELGQPRVPGYFDDILRQTARTRQRPRWTFPERWIPMDIAARMPAGTRLVPLRMIALLVLLIVALAAAILLVGSQQLRRAPLVGPAANGVLIVSRGGDIYVAEPDLNRERVLIGGPENDIAARFSRDGTAIYFGRVTPEGTLVMSANTDGTNIRRVSDTPLQENAGVEVSPDGASLLVINTSGPVATLEIHPLNRSGQPAVFDLGDITPVEFAHWRPGAMEIVFAGQRSTPSMRGVYLVRSDGTGLRTVHELPNVDGFLRSPTMSEDGRRLAYWNDLGTDGIPGRRCNVHVVDLTTGIDRRVVFDETAECEGAAEFLGDDRLVLERSDLVGTTPSAIQLLVAPADGSSFGRPIGPTWDDPELQLWWELSPDRSSVLLFADSGLSGMVSVDGGAIRPLAFDVADYVSWQRRPFGP